MDTCCTPEQLALIGVSTSTFQACFLWGFTAVISIWFLGVIGRAVMDSIKSW